MDRDSDRRPMIPDDAPSFRIAGTDGDALVVSVLRREFPDEQDFWDGNWVDAVAEVTATPFHGSVPFQFELQDLLPFLEGLEAMHRTLRGEASLKTIEGELEVNAGVNSHGHVVFSVRVTASHVPPKALTLEMESDQTFLPPLIAGLRAVLRAYPVRGEPD